MKRILLNTSLMLTLLMVSYDILAFGTVEAVVGNVSVINFDGDTKALIVGSYVESSETIVTGKESEVVIKTDDDGVVFLKSNSKLVVESFSANGNEKDNFAVMLLKGSLRSITGFIGKTAPKRFHLKTPTAVIGIRGTDYQVEIGESAKLTGTFTKVSSGEISLTSRGISVNVAANQFAVASDSAPPQLLESAPAGLFGANQLDEKMDALIKANAGGTALQIQQADQKRGGGDAASGEARIARNCAGDNPAQRTLDEFIQAYERGDIAYIQRRLDPAMVGYGPFLNGMMEDVNAQKQIRFLIQNRNAQCGSDLAVINFRWEKRYLDLVTFQPRLQTGQASVLTYLKAGEWRLSGISGDNPFASTLNRAALLTTSIKAISFAGLPKTSTPSATSTFTGTASADILVGANGLPAACSPDNTTVHCNIGAFTGVGLSNTVSCSGATVAGISFVSAGSIPFTSTGPALATGVTVLVTVPVAGGASGQNASGTVSCSVGIDYPPGAPIFTVTATTIATQFKLTSPNQAGAGSVQIEATANNGDRELLTLNETTPGTFTRSGFNIAGGAVVQNNGVISINAPTIITFKYTDSKTRAITSSFFRVTP
jgi:FecR protein